MVKNGFWIRTGDKKGEWERVGVGVCVCVCVCVCLCVCGVCVR
jgi:hypothetical protein